MPRINLVLPKSVFLQIFKSDPELLKSNFCRELSGFVASCIDVYSPSDISVKNIEVIWKVLDEYFNIPDLTVEVLFSVGGNGFNPTYKQLVDINISVHKFVSEHRLIPAHIMTGGIAVWTRPQTDAVWMFKR